MKSLSREFGMTANRCDVTLTSLKSPIPAVHACLGVYVSELVAQKPTAGGAGSARHWDQTQPGSCPKSSSSVLSDALQVLCYKCFSSEERELQATPKNDFR